MVKWLMAQHVKDSSYNDLPIFIRVLFTLSKGRMKLQPEVSKMQSPEWKSGLDWNLIKDFSHGNQYFSRSESQCVLISYTEMWDIANARNTEYEYSSCIYIIDCRTPQCMCVSCATCR
jgi:hypothetical protein